MHWRRVFQPGWESGVPSLSFISHRGLIILSSISTVMYSGITPRRCVMAQQIVIQLGVVNSNANILRTSGESLFPNMSGSTFCPCCSSFSRGRGQALPFRCAEIYTITGYARPYQILGGEFSSLYQNTFHHYRDFWCFDITTRSWDRIETKVRPSARSGHRFAFSYCSLIFSYRVTT